MYTRIFSALTLCLVLSLCSSCSDSSSSSSPQVQVFTEIASPDVRVAKKEGGSTIQVGSGVADSLTITRARILITRMKMHRVNEDEQTGDRDVKAGPYILTLTAGSAAASFSSDVPEGNYDKIKFEMHKFSGSEAEYYRNNPAFKDFATDDRYTIIVEGTVYKNGKGTAFTYNGDVTANLSLGFGAIVNVSSSSAAGILLRLDAAAAFKTSGVVLDPSDPGNKSTIENAIKAAIRALKK